MDVYGIDLPASMMNSQPTAKTWPCCGVRWLSCQAVRHGVNCLEPRIADSDFRGEWIAMESPCKIVVYSVVILHFGRSVYI